MRRRAAVQNVPANGNPISAAQASDQARLPVPHLAGSAARVDALFPDSAITRHRWDPSRAELVVTLPGPQRPAWSG
jgi:hypothetical protein